MDQVNAAPSLVLPPDHSARVARMLLSLDGLSVGDSFGEQFFAAGEMTRIEQRILDQAPWRYTDDTEMALSIAEVLRQIGHIDTDLLAMHFAHHYASDPSRGYGATAHSILRGLCAGKNYRHVAPAVFDGQGSMGNGAAMRAGPVGAYFAGDSTTRIIEQATLSAEVTHAHPEGIAGAVAVALAAAWACEHRGGLGPSAQKDFLCFVAENMPASYVQQGVQAAASFAPHCSVMMAAAVLGNGSKISAQDTVPFALWCASHHLVEFEPGMWVTVSALGDRDTTCAIVGSIISLSGADVPSSWLASREPLKFAS